MAEDARWMTTWAAAMRAPGTAPLPRPFEDGLENQTLRQVVRATVGGKALRLRISNLYGVRPLRVTAVQVGRGAGEALIQPGTNRRVTFGDATSLRIPSGAEALSDAIEVPAYAGQEIVVSIFIREPSGPPTFPAAGVTTYLAVSDHAADENGASFEPVRLGNGGPVGYFLTSLEVLVEPGVRGGIACLGDSITAQGWPSHLASRVLTAFPKRPFATLNLGVAGNRVLDFGSDPMLGSNPAIPGQSALARLDRDVVSRDGVRGLIFFEGINDIGFDLETNQMKAADLIFGHQQIALRGHAAGLKVFGATLLPFKDARTPRGTNYWSEAGEAKRQALNEWIVKSGAYDGVIDFAAALADPMDPLALRPEYDSGDHLHPNAAGQRALAEAVDLRLLDF